MLGTYLLTGALVAVTLFAALGPIHATELDEDANYDDMLTRKISITGSMVVALLTIALWPGAIGLVAWTNRNQWVKS